MKSEFFLACLILQTAVSKSFSSSCYFQNDKLDPMPTWSYSDICKMLDEHGKRLWPGSKILEAKILIWDEKVDSRPLFIQEAVELVKVSSGTLKRIALINFWRHPKEKYREWTIAGPTDIDWRPVKIFESVPTEKDLGEFLILWNWDFRESDYKIKKYGIRTKTWAKELGFLPTYEYKLVGK